MPRAEKRSSPAKRSRPKLFTVQHLDVPRPALPQQLNDTELAKVHDVFGCDERTLSVRDIRFLCQELSLFFDDEETVVKALKDVGVAMGSEPLNSTKFSVDDFVGLVLHTASNTTGAATRSSKSGNAGEAALFQRCGRWMSGLNSSSSRELPINAWMLQRHLSLLGLPSDSALDAEADEEEVLVDRVGGKSIQHRAVLDQRNQRDVKKISVQHWATSVVNPLEQSMQRKSGQPTFIPADNWKGAIAGYYFSVGAAGLGYYALKDVQLAQGNGIPDLLSSVSNDRDPSPVLHSEGSSQLEAGHSHPLPTVGFADRASTESPRSELLDNEPQVEGGLHQVDVSERVPDSVQPVPSQGSSRKHLSLPSKWFTDCRPKPVHQPRPEPKTGIQSPVKNSLEVSQRGLARKKSRVLEDIRSGLQKRDEGWDAFLTPTELHNLRSEKSVRDVLSYVALRYLAFRRSLETLTPIQKAVIADVPHGCSTAARNELLHQENAAWNAWREQYSKIRRSTDDICSRTAEERLRELDGFADVQPLRERGSDPLLNEQTATVGHDHEVGEDEEYRHLSLDDFAQFLASLEGKRSLQRSEQRKAAEAGPKIISPVQASPVQSSPSRAPSKPAAPKQGAVTGRVRKMEYAIDRWRQSKEAVELQATAEKVEKLLQHASTPPVLPRRTSSTPRHCQPPRVARVMGTLQRAGHSTVEFRKKRSVAREEDFVIA